MRVEMWDNVGVVVDRKRRGSDQAPKGRGLTRSQYVWQSLHVFLRKHPSRQVISPAAASPAKYIAIVNLPLNHNARDDRKAPELPTFHQPRDCLVNRPGVRKGRMA